MADNDSFQLYTTLKRLGRQIHRLGHELHQDQYFFLEQTKLLHLISKNDGIIQRELAEQADVRPPSMTEMLVKIEKLGVIERKPDEKDQRVIHVHLTKKGKVVAGKTMELIDEFVNTIFKVLTNEEKKQMLQLASKVYNSLDAMNLDEDKREYHSPEHGRNQKKKK